MNLWHFLGLFLFAMATFPRQPLHLSAPPRHKSVPPVSPPPPPPQEKPTSQARFIFLVLLSAYPLSYFSRSAWAAPLVLAVAALIHWRCLHGKAEKLHEFEL